MEEATENAQNNPPPAEDGKYIITYDAERSLQALFEPSHYRILLGPSQDRRRIDLGFSVSRTLELLIEKADQIVERGEILEFAWNGRVVSQNSINQAISKLRELLEDNETKGIIQTIPRRGYSFNAMYAQKYEPTKNPIHSPNSEALPHKASTLAPGYMRHVIAWSVVALLSALLAWRIEWKLWITQDFYTNKSQVNLTEIKYISHSEQDLENLIKESQALINKIKNLKNIESKLIVSRMHSYIDLICIGKHENVYFITTHLSKISLISPEEIYECLN